MTFVVPSPSSRPLLDFAEKVRVAQTVFLENRPKRGRFDENGEMMNLHSTQWKQGLCSSDPRKGRRWLKWRVSLMQAKAGFRKSRVAQSCQKSRQNCHKNVMTSTTTNDGKNLAVPFLEVKLLGVSPGDPFSPKSYRDFGVSFLGTWVFGGTLGSISPHFDLIWPILTYLDLFRRWTWPLLTYFDLFRRPDLTYFHLFWPISFHNEAPWTGLLEIAVRTARAQRAHLFALSCLPLFAGAAPENGPWPMGNEVLQEKGTAS